MTKRKNDYLGGVLLILVGLVFLASNLDLVPWHVWGNLWKFWPLILVAIGLKKLLER